MSGRLFSPRQSIELDKNGRFNLRPASTKSRSALHERTPSDLNRENGEHPTIRLVGSNNSLKNVYNKNPFPHKPAQVLQPTKTTKHGYTIQNDQGISSLNAKVHDKLDPSAGQTGRLSAQSTNNRHSKRSSNFSQSTTTSAADTYCNDDSLSPTSCRFSMDGTLRNTPTPIASEEREKERMREEAALPAVAETSFEASTIRPVTASSSSGPGSRGSDAPKNDTSNPQAGRSVSLATTSASGSSGPNIEVYDVSSPSQYSSTPPEHSRSNSYNVIRYAKSTESMTSVQYAQVRPPTAQSQSASSAWSSSETENLPPLSVAKKRTHMHSASAGAGVVRMSNLSTIASESEPSSQSIIRELSSSTADIFTSPPVVHPSSQSGNWYVRRQTIGSSSYSSILTDSNYQSLSTESSRWELNRENSAVPEPLFSSSPREPQQLSSPIITHPSSSGIHELPSDFKSEQDDTIAELQAHPLRTQRSGLLSRGRSASDPRPASARSNHTLATTYNPDRGSQGSSIFPQWAKSFYRGKLHFPHGNESSVSLALSDGQLPPHNQPPPAMRMLPWAHHRRWESAGNSLMSMQQSSQGGTPRSASPKSSHFLPSIFRPYRPRANMNQSQSTSTMSVTRSSSLAELYVDESQLDFSDNDTASSTSSSTDSMAITTIPRGRHSSAPAFQPPRRQQTVNSGRAIPRDQTYSSSNYPQSLAASHMYNTPPHLAPSRRLSHRLSTWRAPSFDEALNSLIFSRGNRQILFFCLGFLCPIFWIIAAFLPLPHRPMETTMTNIESLQDVPELEGEKGHYPLGLQAEMRNWDLERRYLKARWWRNLNRIMSFVGVALIGAIIALAVIASK